MKTPTLILGFARYNNAALAVKARHIISRMTGNAYFPDPFPKLDVITTQADAYDAALQALNRSEARKLAFAKERQGLEQLLRQLGRYVLLHGEDDPVILESSGFDLGRTGARRTAGTVAVDGFKVKPGTVSGTMYLSCEGVSRCRAYVFRYTQAPVSDDSRWISTSGSRSSKLLEGLTPGVQYAFQICIIDTNAREVAGPMIYRYGS